MSLADTETRKFWAGNNTPGKKGFQSKSSTSDSLGRTEGTTGDSLAKALGLSPKSEGSSGSGSTGPSSETTFGAAMTSKSFRVGDVVEIKTWAGSGPQS